MVKVLQWPLQSDSCFLTFGWENSRMQWEFVHSARWVWNDARELFAYAFTCNGAFTCMCVFLHHIVTMHNLLRFEWMHAFIKIMRGQRLILGQMRNYYISISLAQIRFLLLCMPLLQGCIECLTLKIHPWSASKCTWHRQRSQNPFPNLLI